MPVFTRRKIQIMLDDVRRLIPDSKAREIAGRINNKDTNQAIAQEYELAIIWSASKVSTIEIEREVSGKYPDFYSEDLLVEKPGFFEIAAMSDVSLSGEDLMKRTCNIINNFSDSVVKGASSHLYYEFHAESGYISAKGQFPQKSRYFRRRRVTKEFKLDDNLRSAIVNWLKSNDPRSELRLTTNQIDVTMTWKDSVHPHGNFFSSMPSETYDVINNPLRRVLRDKEREQLGEAPAGAMRCIILADSGSTLLRDIGRARFNSSDSVRGEYILGSFIEESTIDYVFVLSPGRKNPNDIRSFGNPRIWRLSIFCKKSNQIRSLENIKRMVEMLPEPYLDGYQARSWHQQGMFEPQAIGHHLPPSLTTQKGKIKMKVSARGIQEYLAGRLTREQFKHFVADDLFERALAGGRTISNVGFEAKGADADDDYLIFEFSDDPSARPIG